MVLTNRRGGKAESRADFDEVRDSSESKKSKNTESDSGKCLKAFPHLTESVVSRTVLHATSNTEYLSIIPAKLEVWVTLSSFSND